MYRRNLLGASLIAAATLGSGVDAQSQAWTYGFAKPGAGGYLPAIVAAGGLPDTGNAAFGISMVRGIGGNAAALVVGSGASAMSAPWGGTIWVNPLLLWLPATLGGSGSQTVPMPIPASSQLHGASLYFQWFGLDSGVPSNIVHTEGLGVTVGDRNVARQCSSAIGYGDYASCSLSPGGLGLFFFQASAGDAVYIRSVASGFQPRVLVFHPNGTQLHNVDPGCADRTEIVSILPVAGTYQIHVRDGSCSGPSQAGAFGLYLQKVNGAAAPDLSAGSSLQSRIESMGHVGAHTFAATAGDVFHFRATASGHQPRMLVFDPAGGLTAADPGCTDLVEDRSYQATLTGTHTLLMTDGTCSGSGQTGGYSLFLQNTKSPASAVGFPTGKTLSGGLMTPGDADSYTVSLAASDVLHARVVSSGHQPRLAVFDPTGKQVVDADAGCNDEIVFLSSPVTVAGTYTVVMRDGTCSGSRQSGDYGIQLQNVTNPGACSVFPLNTTQQLALSRRGETVPFCVPIKRAGAAVLITVTALGGFQPEFTLYDPAGTPLGTAVPGCSAQTTMSFNNLAPGNHLLQIQDGSCSGSGQTGAATVSVVCTTAGGC